MSRPGPEAMPPTPASSLDRVQAMITTPLRKKNAFDAQSPAPHFGFEVRYVWGAKPGSQTACTMAERTRSGHCLGKEVLANRCMRSLRDDPCRSRLGGG